MSYIDQRNALDALSNNGSYLKDYFRETVSKMDKIAFDIFLSTRFSCGDRSKLSMLIDIERVRANKTPAKDIPFSVFKAMIAEEGIPVDDRNKLIKERGDKRFKELL
ncbi:MAG: hypothetical protein CM15mV46_840 [Caudoviricetes sp.]|nr:MAG: hypothetical protein CM15mV46_840 [Caudoviricetes sp.]